MYIVEFNIWNLYFCIVIEVRKLLIYSIKLKSNQGIAMLIWAWRFSIATIILLIEVYNNGSSAYKTILAQGKTGISLM